MNMKAPERVTPTGEADTMRSGLNEQPANPKTAEYQPTSRRPIGEIFRKTAHGAVKICVACNIHPDVISYLSMVMAAGAGICFWAADAHPLGLLTAPLFCYARLWCNMLDGMVALASGKASWRGEILNDFPDRISDVLIFAGVAHSGLNTVESGYWAAIFALLTAYIGMFGQAVGVQREFSGLMSKPWRMVTLHVGAWMTLGLIWWDNGNLRYGGLTVLDWTCVVVIVGCVQTIVVRLKRIMRALAEKKSKGK
jgi:phosphatidylglycerophosphate synthase